MSESKISKAFGNATKGGESKNGDSVMKKVLDENNLMYNFSKDLSSVSVRSHKKYFSQKTSYGENDTMIFEIGSGSDYCYGPNSYLSFKVKVLGTSGDTGNLDVGGSSNFIRNVWVSSRTGKELIRIDKFNVFNAMRKEWTKSPDELATKALVEGYNTAVATADYVNLVFKLSDIPFFNSESPIPSVLLSGMRINIELESHKTVFRQTAGTLITGYEISDPYLCLDSLSLIDSVSKALLQRAATQGLKYEFTTVSTTSGSLPMGSTNIRLDSRKSVSRALKVFSLLRDDVVITDVSSKSLEPQLGLGWANTQFRLGSIYLPAAEVTRDSERYLQTVQAWDQKPNNVSYTDYITATTGRNLWIGQDLARSHVVELSAVPVNNSRNLTLNATLVAPFASTVKTVDMFMVHERRVIAFVNNTITEE